LDCVVEAQKVQPHAWQTYYYQTLLGRALRGTAQDLRVDDPIAAYKNLAKAESVLREGCEGMIARQDTIDAQHKPCLIEALQGLIELYTQLERPEDAARWTSELEERTSNANLSTGGLSAKAAGPQ
jgi:hypothetical protein